MLRKKKVIFPTSNDIVPDEEVQPESRTRSQSEEDALRALEEELEAETEREVKVIMAARAPSPRVSVPYTYPSPRVVATLPPLSPVVSTLTVASVTSPVITPVPVSPVVGTPAPFSPTQSERGVGSVSAAEARDLKLENEQLRGRLEAAQVELDMEKSRRYAMEQELLNAQADKAKRVALERDLVEIQQKLGAEIVLKEQAERKLIQAQHQAQSAMNKSLETSMHSSYQLPHEQVEQQAMKWRAMVEEIRVRQKTVIQSLEKRIASALAAEAEARAIQEEFLNALIDARVKLIDSGVSVDPMPNGFSKLRK